MIKGFLTTFFIAFLTLIIHAQEDDQIPFPILDYDLYDSIYQAAALQTPSFLGPDWTGDMCLLPSDDPELTDKTPEYRKKWLTSNGYYPSLQIGYARKNDHYGSKEVIIAVIDDGIDFDSEEFDLIGKEWINKDEIPGNNHDDDGNGLVDDVFGFDFGSNTSDRSSLINSTGGHGTLMAKTIGANENDDCGTDNNPNCSQSMLGIMNEVTIMNLKVTDSDNLIDPKAIAKALKYSADKGAQIINLSISLYPEFPTCPHEGMTEQELEIDFNEDLTEALEYAWTKGSLVVVGNGNRNLGDGNDIANSRRSHYGELSSHPSVISVGGVRRYFLIHDYNITTWGDNVDVVTFSQYLGGGGSGRQGTSYSAAIVSGMAGLLLSTDMSLKNYELKEIILEAAYDTINTVVPDDGHQYYYYYDSINTHESINDHTGIKIIKDTLGYDSYYGWGFVRWPEIYNRRKGRDLSIDPVTGAVNNYNRRSHFDLNEVVYDSVFCYKEPDPLGILNDKLIVYPNPVVNHLSIKNYNNSSYELFDLTGQIIDKGHLTNGLLAMGHLPNGLYLLRVDNKVIRIKKN